MFLPLIQDLLEVQVAQSPMIENSSALSTTSSRHKHHGYNTHTSVAIRLSNMVWKVSRNKLHKVFFAQYSNYVT